MNDKNRAPDCTVDDRSVPRDEDQDVYYVTLRVKAQQITRRIIARTSLEAVIRMSTDPDTKVEATIGVSPIDQAAELPHPVHLRVK